MRQRYNLYVAITDGQGWQVGYLSEDGRIEIEMDQYYATEEEAQEYVDFLNDDSKGKIVRGQE